MQLTAAAHQEVDLGISKVQSSDLLDGNLQHWSKSFLVSPV